MRYPILPQASRAAEQPATYDGIHQSQVSWANALYGIRTHTVAILSGLPPAICAKRADPGSSRVDHSRGNPLSLTLYSPLWGDVEHVPLEGFEPSLGRV